MLTDFRADRVLLNERTEWAHGLAMRLPADLLPKEGSFHFDDPQFRAKARTAAEDLRLRAAFIRRPPVSTRLPISYRSMPASARRLIANALGRLKRRRQASWAQFPAWPIDLSADFASDLAQIDTVTFQRTPVLLTHDIDSPEGLQNLVKMFLPIEEHVGARSANYIVPCAWTLDHGLLKEVEARGHEIGVHGYDHSNRTAFGSARERQRRLKAGYRLSELYRICGYRAPSLVRTRELIVDLASFYRYDSSIPTAGGPFPVANNGCASARPWRFGTLWEIPLSMPRDGSLRFLGHSPSEIGAMWREIAAIIKKSRGIVTLLTHCEAGFSGNASMLTLYQHFLKWLGENQYEFLRPADLIARIEARYGATAVCGREQSSL